MTTRLRLAVLAVASFFVAATAVAAEASTDDLIREGVALHDQRRYDDAIARYQQALAKEPANAVALYELANSYFATQRLDLCVQTARKGLAAPGKVEVELYTVLGSCLSERGRKAEALEVFYDAVKKHPNDATLNFNAGVVFAAMHADDDAMAAAERAIAAWPDYASAYLLLGNLLARQQRYAVAALSQLRFLAIEPISPRAPEAAKAMFANLGAGVQRDGKNVNVNFPSGMRDDPLSGLELARSLSAAADLNDEDKTKSVAERRVGSFVTLVQIASEMAASDRPIDQAPLWSPVLAPAVELHEHGLLEPLAFVAAARAGLAGADAWLAANPKRVAALEAALGKPVR